MHPAHPGRPLGPGIRFRPYRDSLRRSIEMRSGQRPRVDGRPTAPIPTADKPCPVDLESIPGWTPTPTPMTLDWYGPVPGPAVDQPTIRDLLTVILGEAADRFGLVASQLAGLHVHFFLATAGHARAGDFGSFVTAAEWLDVNYGRLARDLFLGDLGGHRLTVIEPAALPFARHRVTASAP